MRGKVSKTLDEPIQVYRNQLIGRVSLLRGVTGNNEESVLGSIPVAAVRIPPCSESTVGHVNRLCTPVAVVLTILADDVGQIAGNSYILKRVVQEGVFRLTVLSIIVDTAHCPVALEKTWLYVLDFKPMSLGEPLRQSTKGTHCTPKSQQH